MKRPVQNAEQQESASNIIKFCTCRTILNSRFERKIREYFSAMERRFDHGPISHPPLQKAYSIILAAHFAWKKTFRAPSRRAGPATRSQTQTSPKTAPATKNASHDWSSSRNKGPVQCAERQESSSSIIKYCACQEFLSSSFDGTSCHEKSHNNITKCLPLLYSCLSTLLYSTVVSASPPFSTLLYSTLLFSTLRYSSLLFYFTLLYSILFYSTLPWSTLLSTLLYSSVL